MGKLAILLPTVLLALLLGCDRSSPTPAASASELDFVDWESFTHNGVPLKGEVAALRKLGPPDSVWRQTQTFRFRVAEDSIATEKREIEVRSYNGHLYLHVLPDSSYLVQAVYFRDDLFEVKHPLLTLTAQTTLEDMRAPFPHSYAARLSVSEIGSDDIVEERIILGTSEENRNGSLKSLDVSFEKGKLRSMLLN